MPVNDIVDLERFPSAEVVEQSLGVFLSDLQIIGSTFS
jgi:hypothetical protein